MSNNRQQHARVILLVAFTSILATSLIMATTINGDAFAGKKKIQNQDNGDNVKKDNVKYKNNGNNGGDSNNGNENGPDGKDQKGGNGSDGADA